jgi:NADH dehydrogenase
VAGPRHRRRVLIAGGGFAGLSAALALDPEDHDVTLFDPTGWFEWLPNIHELLSGVKTPELLRLPLDRILRRAGHRFVREAVVGIEPGPRRVETARAGGVEYDALVLALGGVDSARGVEGVAPNAFPFKSVAACHRIGRRLARLGSRRKPAHVVIVGGGLEGVEALGEILRRHRGDRMRLSVVDAEKQLLSDAPPALDAHVRSLCEPYGVAFHLGTKVEAIERDRVILEGGATLPSDLTIWTGGTAPPPLLAEAGLAAPGEWAPVDGSLESERQPGIFVAGDAAELPTPIDKQAYHALDMGTLAARNVARRLGGRSLDAFEPSPKPKLISFGDVDCMLATKRVALAGPALGALKEAVYEIGMAQLDARLLEVRLPALFQRGALAARQLAWPTLRSPRALLRQGRLRLLSTG